VGRGLREATWSDKPNISQQGLFSGKVLFKKTVGDRKKRRFGLLNREIDRVMLHFNLVSSINSL
jgi:hypothetical protein